MINFQFCIFAAADILDGTAMAGLLRCVVQLKLSFNSIFFNILTCNSFARSKKIIFLDNGIHIPAFT